jgi:HPt (histidine-containing phosphotransfer) domain-containing protein
MANDEGLFREMVLHLCRDAPPLVSRLRAAHQHRDAKEMELAAHTLKGLASNFAARRAVAAAAELERLAKEGPSAGVPAALTELEHALEELVAALAPYREPTALP